MTCSPRARRDRPLQYIDCRDLAIWMLHAAERRISGAFNTVSQPGHATMESLLDAAVAATGSEARLVWVAPEVIEAAGHRAVDRAAGLDARRTGRAARCTTGTSRRSTRPGLICRPVEETVADTWRWLQAEGDPPASARAAVARA